MKQAVATNLVRKPRPVKAESIKSPCCNERLLWETIGQVLTVFREVAGIAAYSAQCAKCGMSLFVERNSAQS